MDAPNHLLGTPELDAGDAPDQPPVSHPAAPEIPAQADAPDGGGNGAALTGLDRKQAAEAYKKVLAGQELTVREQTLLKRIEKEKEERLRWQYYAAIPQKHWRDMSGRQTKVINEQAVRYGIPFGGATINLPTVVRSLHDFLADNAQKLAQDDDALMQGSGSLALERYREERAAIARLDRLEREGSLLPRDEVREALGRIASILRGAGDTLQRQFGQTAADILLEALDDAGREIERAFEAPEDDIGQPAPEPLSAPAD